MSLTILHRIISRLPRHAGGLSIRTDHSTAGTMSPQQKENEMSKLKELEDYAETATGQAKKVAELTVAAIREAMSGETEPQPIGYKDGQPIYEVAD